jgi:hypothetical protein
MVLGGFPTFNPSTAQTWRRVTVELVLEKTDPLQF